MDCRLNDICEYDWVSYDGQNDNTGGTTAATLASLLTVTDHVSILSILIDCQDKQLPFAFFTNLARVNGSLESLTINNLPPGCRVCIYDLFRKLLFFDWLRLQKLVVARTYVDECYIGLGDQQFPPLLTHVTLFGIGLTSIPSTIRSLTNLVHLCVANNIITDLSHFLNDNKLQELSILDLSENCLAILPDSLFELRNLSVLDISHNWMKKTIPKLLSQLDSLVELYLEWNRLEYIPEDIIEALPHLSLLDVSYNKIKFMSARVFFHPSLVLLNLAGNSILTLGEDIERPMRQSPLQELDISETDLCDFPSWIDGLSNLKALKCANNELQEFGAILKLSNLQIIGLRNNNIKDTSCLVSNISNLPHLCKLDVSYNLIDTFPLELQGSATLIVDIEGNPRNSLLSTDTSQVNTESESTTSALKKSRTLSNSTRWSRLSCLS